jgi:hypothetical protein
MISFLFLQIWCYPWQKAKLAGRQMYKKAGIPPHPTPSRSEGAGSPQKNIFFALINILVS